MIMQTMKLGHFVKHNFDIYGKKLSLNTPYRSQFRNVMSEKYRIKVPVIRYNNRIKRKNRFFRYIMYRYTSLFRKLGDIAHMIADLGACFPEWPIIYIKTTFG